MPDPPQICGADFFVQRRLYGLAGGAMEISKESKNSAKNQTPVIGVETHELLGDKFTKIRLSHTEDRSYYKAETEVK